MGTTEGSTIATCSVVLIGITGGQRARWSGNADLIVKIHAVETGLTGKIKAAEDKIYGAENKIHAVETGLTDKIQGVKTRYKLSTRRSLPFLINGLTNMPYLALKVIDVGDGRKYGAPPGVTKMGGGMQEVEEEEKPYKPLSEF